MNRVPTPGQAWAIVLAAGEGSRLSILTRDAAGDAVPKQFCSLTGGASLIEQTLARASAIVPRERVIAVVSAAHARHWRSALDLPAGNIVVQPLHRGTAIGILLPILHVLARDADARVLVLPSDHHVEHEGVLEGAMRDALQTVDHDTGVALLGIEADEPDPELGYIVPRAGVHASFHRVHRFIEKPSVDEARRLCREGALWNSFILAGRARSFLELCRSRYPDVVEALRAIELSDARQLLKVYEGLPVADFSRDVATGQEERLAVMSVAPCGWNDLGTPRRLAQTLAGSSGQAPTPSVTARSSVGGRINLAERLTQLHPILSANERASALTTIDSAPREEARAEPRRRERDSLVPKDREIIAGSSRNVRVPL